MAGEAEWRKALVSEGTKDGRRREVGKNQNNDGETGGCS